MSIASPSAVIMNDALADSINVSEVPSLSNDFDLSRLNELSLDGESGMVGATEFLDRVLSPINKAENRVVEKVSSFEYNTMKPEQLIEIQKSFVEYNTNLIVASKCAKFVGDFVKETTHIQ